MRRGLSTTEFWLTLAVVLMATLLAFFGHLSDDQWMTIAVIATGAYSIARGLAKHTRT